LMPVRVVRLLPSGARMIFALLIKEEPPAPYRRAIICAITGVSQECATFTFIAMPLRGRASGNGDGGNARADTPFFVAVAQDARAMLRRLVTAPYCRTRARCPCACSVGFVAFACRHAASLYTGAPYLKSARRRAFAEHTARSRACFFPDGRHPSAPAASYPSKRQRA